MKVICMCLFCLILAGCTDHDKVINQYKKGNSHATDLLMHGLNMKNSEYISSHLIKRSLDGDLQAKEIVYAEIESLKGLTVTGSRPVPVFVPIRI